MSKQPFFKRTPVKILLLTLFFALIIVIGFIPLTIVLVMDQTLFIRILIAASGIIWAILTVNFISFKTESAEHLVNFNVDLLEYTGMNEEFNVVYDAIAIARAIRNFIIQKSEEAKTEVID